SGEHAFIVSGVVPNRKGQPLLVEWQVAISRDDSTGFTLEPFATFLSRAGLKAGALPNPGQELPLEKLQRRVPGAVRAMRAHMIARQAAFSGDMNARLEGTLADLQRLQGRQIEQLEFELEKVIEGVKRARFERRSRYIHRVFDD